jgi:hypothetical protein
MGTLSWRSSSKKHFVSDINRDRTNAGMEILACKNTKSGQWSVLKNTEGVVFIVLDLITKNDGVYYVKSIQECMHPFYYDCPVEFLDLAPVDNQEWRDGVKEFSAKRKVKFSIGDVVKVYNKIYKITGKMKRSYYMLGPDNRVYKFSKVEDMERV